MAGSTTKAAQSEPFNAGADPFLTQVFYYCCLIIRQETYSARSIRINAAMRRCIWQGSGETKYSTRR